MKARDAFTLRMIDTFLSSLSTMTRNCGHRHLLPGVEYKLKSTTAIFLSSSSTVRNYETQLSAVEKKELKRTVAIDRLKTTTISSLFVNYGRYLYCRELKKTSVDSLAFGPIGRSFLFFKLRVALSISRQSDRSDPHLLRFGTFVGSGRMARGNSRQQLQVRAWTLEIFSKTKGNAEASGERERDTALWQYPLSRGSS